MSESSTFPFLASFELQGQNSKTAPNKVTYVALSKKAMPWFKDNIDLYMDGTMEALLRRLEKTPGQRSTMKMILEIWRAIASRRLEEEYYPVLTD
jgi:hypothetical protein